MKDFQIKLEPGEVIILAGFGVGLTSSVVVYGIHHKTFIVYGSETDLLKDLYEDKN